MRRPARHLPAAALVAAAGLFAASPALAGDDRVRTQGDVARYTAQVPAGAQARFVAVYDTTGDSTFRLQLQGFPPRARFGVHGHAARCAATAGAPDEPSANAAFPGADVWLTVRTDARGQGTARAMVPWQFAPGQRPRSVMIHAEPTSPGSTGSRAAGAPLACLTVRF